MCCRRRNPHTRRRLPLLILLGKLLYDKYHARQTQRKETLALDRTRSPSAEKLSLGANAEVLEKAGLAPPSPPAYEDVVVRAPNGNARGRKSGEEEWVGELQANEDREDLSDDEEIFDVGVDGRRVPSRELQGAQERFIGKWKRRNGMV